MCYSWLAPVAIEHSDFKPKVGHIWSKQLIGDHCRDSWRYHAQRRSGLEMKWGPSSVRRMQRLSWWWRRRILSARGPRTTRDSRKYIKTRNLSWTRPNHWIFSSELFCVLCECVGVRGVTCVLYCSNECVRTVENLLWIDEFPEFRNSIGEERRIYCWFICIINYRVLSLIVIK